MSGLEYKMKGNLIYEFAFEVGDEVYQLSQELKNKNKWISNILYEKTKWYYNTFWLPLLKTSLREKQLFYKLIRNNRFFVKGKISEASLYAKLFTVPFFGIWLAVIAKPIYKTKKRLLLLKTKCSFTKAVNFLFTLNYFI